MQIYRGKRNHGFSLVEVLISLAILALGSLAITSTIAVGTGLQQEALEINTAGKSANMILESFRKMPYIVLMEGIPNGTYAATDLGTVFDSELNTYDLLDSGTLFQITQDLTRLDLQEEIVVSQAEDSMMVNVRVFRTRDLTNPIVSMMLFVSKNGINFR